MNKKSIIIGIIVAVLLAAGVFGAIAYFSGGSEGQKREEVIPTPTASEKLKEADESVVADITINSARTVVALELSGLDGRYDGISYELRYKSDDGEKGAVGGLRTPIPLEPESDTFTRDIELGTCSTGGKCRYDRGVSNFSLTVKLHTTDGEVEILQETYEKL